MSTVNHSTEYKNNKNNKNSRKPLIRHFREKNRNVTVAYTKNRDNGTITYAAVVFRKMKKSDHWDKSAHVKTAESRFVINPVTVTDFPYYSTVDEHKKNFAKNLRRCVMRFGTKARDDYINDWTMPELVN